MDYAIQKGVSLSTLRRQIKADKVEYRLEKGRYFIRNRAQAAPPAQKEDNAGFRDRIRQLEFQLIQAQDEISELKMLISLYENKIPPSLDQ